MAKRTNLAHNEKGALPQEDRFTHEQSLSWVSALKDGERRGHVDWKQAIRHTIQQNSLIDTKSSLRALERTSLSYRPMAVFMGIGLCSGTNLSRGLPLDAVGYVLAAEAVRKSIKAKSLIVLIADTHAISCGLPETAVNDSARDVISVLNRIRDLGRFTEMKLIKASELHSRYHYRSIFETVCSRTSAFDHPYFTKEAADIEFIRRQHNTLLKIGWSMGGTESVRDERAFDRCYEKWVGNRVAFVYTKPGRTLDDTHPRGVPYIETDLNRRICIRKGEKAGEKLRAGLNNASQQNTRAVRTHTKAVCRLYSKMVETLHGDVETRADRIITSLANNDGESADGLSARKNPPGYGSLI